MSEILFRGKRVDNGEWICGGYWLNDTATRQTPHIIDDDGNSHTVIAKTIGQYTGLKDKNGVKIFVGDVVEEKRKVDKENQISIYEIDIKSQMCVAKNVDKNVDKNISISLCTITIETDIEVVGDIHDNAELLIK